MSIRVQQVQQVGGVIEILIHGDVSDAFLVRDCLVAESGVSVANTKAKEGMPGFCYLVVHGTREQPLTVERTVQLLNKHPNIETVV